MNKLKIVSFVYCNQCKYKELEENEHPCDDCLAEPVKIDSHRPVYFEEAPSQNQQ